MSTDGFDDFIRARYHRHDESWDEQDVLNAPSMFSSYKTLSTMKEFRYVYPPTCHLVVAPSSQNSQVQTKHPHDSATPHYCASALHDLIPTTPSSSPSLPNIQTRQNHVSTRFPLHRAHNQLLARDPRLSPLPSCALEIRLPSPTPRLTFPRPTHQTVER